MKLVTYNYKKYSNVGLILDGLILNICEFQKYYKNVNKFKSKVMIPNDMKTLLESGSSVINEIKLLEKYIKKNILPDIKEVNSLFKQKIIFSNKNVKIVAPILNPQKIVAIGLNYMDHCREQHIDPPKQPVIFAKYPTSIIGQNDYITWSSQLTQQVDYEAELGVIIGKRARNVSVDKAFDYVFGYTCVNDVSARDLQFGDGQWVRGKSLDTFCPIGPYIVTKDEVSDPQNLSIKCIVNGVTLQDSNTKEMIFKIQELISFATSAFTLLPGDIISTGTPNGVGVFRNPKVFLKSGDEVKVKIEKVGDLINRVK
ncbi:MAG: fumarylacetoacetate hydrolase family protein [Ignavibacteriaceae bacterium]